jgi:Histidine kinase-, DNA gyrase B-, and HSP90-like ATPase
MSQFTVDTHLFRELGELLVGRDSTALIELIKNAYDADATEVTVIGKDLGDVGKGSISVIDDGIGMTLESFETGFLRIASRTKEEGPRLSPIFRRRYTGAKGIGRLAAHKLARHLHLVSRSLKNGKEGAIVEATIDWDEVERHETLDQLVGTDAVSTETITPTATRRHGTRITLTRLRRRWTNEERSRFISEIQTFSAPDILVALPKVTEFPLLLPTVMVREASGNASQGTFEVKLEDEFASSDEYWQTIAQAVDWIVEIDALSRPGTVRYQVTPTRKTGKSLIDAKPSFLAIDHPQPDTGPFFQARILVREGQLAGAVASKEARSWISGFSGIRVFLEGFRVLPYGEKSNDWLSLDLDYTTRSRKLPWSDEPSLFPPTDSDVGLNVLPNRHYFGAVFLTQKNTSALKMLINREGFLPEASYHTLVLLVRRGIDFSTRIRAAGSI